jgi:hypothetical protein
MKWLSAMGAGTLVLLTGCAGVMPKAHIFSPAERLQPGPWQSLDISGEARFCIGPYASQTASARKQALDNIAQACGGEDRYHVVREGEADMFRFRGAGGLIETSCDTGRARAILFKCSGPRPQPAAAPTR